MKKILIANRGEIALRIMRSAKEMGIKTVAVYSEADRLAPHVRFADEAVAIGPAPSSQSYLKGEVILEAAKRTGAEGIHPGYGFLSENADFCQAVNDAGLIFIGPNPDSIRMMGNKLAAKQAAKDFGVPLVPGTDTAITDVDEAIATAEAAGFPVLIKAAAGGGGKGMRVVEKAADFREQLERAISEAKSAFGDGSVFVEKYVTCPRHIEIQVLCDRHGNQVHLFERECSIQRRHQKVVEEAPSSVLTPELREKMGQSALAIAKACDYVGAGTVEFLVDDKLNYYFLEMNTRLQVEHPVTEMITGLDLVKEQIRIARGEALSFSQNDLKINGHSIELRVYAEDPWNNFLPDTGTLLTYRRPAGPGIRVDDGFEQGMTIPVYYDPMIAKLTVWASNRREAIERMRCAIEDYHVIGLKNTLPFGTFVMQHPAFISGEFDTGFIARFFNTEENVSGAQDDHSEIAALLAAWLFEENKNKKNAVLNGTLPGNPKPGKWKKAR